jgi:hypothetical protein
MKNTLALSAAAIALLLTPVASAGVITLKVWATLTPNPEPGNPAACTTTWKLGGQVVINNSLPDPGVFVSADITATGFSPSVGPFTTGLKILPSTGTQTDLEAKDSAGDFLDLIISTLKSGSVVGYTGGPMAPGGTVFGPLPSGATVPALWDVTSGSLTAIPEPSTWALMALGFAGLGFASWRSRRGSVSIAA